MITIAKLWILPVDTVTSDASEEGRRYITEDKRAKLLRFRQEEDRQRGLWAELLVRSVICRELAIANRAIVFAYNAYGKPELAGETGLQFNVSHSGRWVVCLTDEHPVGVDIEQIAPLDREVAHSVFTEAEVQYVEGATHSADRHNRFFQVWTAKESCIKAVGKGLSLPLQNFSVVPAIQESGTAIIEGESWQLRQLVIDPAYRLTACCKPQSSWNGMEQVDAAKILSKIGPGIY
ncbi:4'-phosphopantetheinyl transferase Sfp [Paenibacillus solanacearum]|uniref:4'-phosphopantetheinyl transferase Sfp n=1 Tax=Paenibacillus solanacearum TaxID=2048548 RepID=A0A916NKM5_9BACL|nr:4'-phosphopantetheinyl transferase superfamily protein [Paenibacillus solanacearum]CAG7594737.1 4'-phosphopantetheinyl transferase Sfp [Paenibacillus solanacearum]